MSYKIAVVGATGNVGREILEILAQREFPVGEVVALASRSSLGKQVSFGEEKILEVKALDDYDFKGTDIALFSPGSNVSKIHAPRAAAAGCVVIDNTSYFRMDPNVPLVVPEVNSHALKDFRKSNIIANPNCSTIQMVVALSPLHAVNPIKRVVVSTYQSVSGAGKEAMDELFAQTRQRCRHRALDAVGIAHRDFRAAGNAAAHMHQVDMIRIDAERHPAGLLFTFGEPLHHLFRFQTEPPNLN